MATTLYRLGNFTPMNFTARPQDTVGVMRGLSFSDVQPIVRAQVIDSTLLTPPMAAIYTPDAAHPDHYSVRPNPDPHPYPLLVAWAATRAGIAPNAWPPPANATISQDTIRVRNARTHQIN